MHFFDFCHHGLVNLMHRYFIGWYLFALLFNKICSIDNPLVTWWPFFRPTGLHGFPNTSERSTAQLDIEEYLHCAFKDLAEGLAVGRGPLGPEKNRGRVLGVGGWVRDEITFSRDCSNNLCLFKVLFCFLHMVNRHEKPPFGDLFQPRNKQI